MRRLGGPEVCFVLALLALGAIGAFLLASEHCTVDGANELEHHASRHYWRSAFDALSAACGVGLLQYDFNDEYTARGRWMLTAVGLAGAIAYLFAAVHAARRLRAVAIGTTLPPAWGIVGLFVISLALCTLVVAVIELVSGAGSGAADATWRAVAAFASLGWTRPLESDANAWIIAGVAWIGALGWPIWIFLFPAARRAFQHAWRAWLSVASYTAFLLLVAAALLAFDAQKRVPVRRNVNAAAAEQSAWSRYGHNLTQTVCASAAGIPLDDLSDRGTTEGRKFVLAGALLVGGMGGSSGGGVKWPLFAWAAAGGAVVLGASRRRASRHAATLRCVQAGSACLLLMLGLACTVALGLLAIEAWTDSRFQHPHTFADAFLDACSVVAGGNLSSGLTAGVTGENLSSGGRQSVDQYQYGMVWLMLAMLAGRVLPLFVVRRMADVKIGDTPTGVSPLI